MKIAIIGYSGAGKSTLAKQLGELFALPVLHLDRVNFAPDWQQRDKAVSQAEVREFMQQDGWVIDGNYRGLYQKERLQEADLVIDFQYNRLLCFYQALHRRIQFHGKVRDSSAPGCVEKMDWAFIRWILYDGRTAQRKAHHRQIALSYPDKIVILKNRKDLNRFLMQLGKKKQNQLQ